MEVLFYTDISGQPNNVNTVEIINGQSSTSYKGGASSRNTLCCLQNDYILSALPRKSVLNVFELNRHGQQSQKVITPGVVKALCVSTDGMFLAAGIEERVLLWNAISGELIASLAKHYQEVTQLSFTCDSSVLVSSGQDGLVAFWDMATVVDTWSNDSRDPYLCLPCHSLPVTHLWSSLVGGGRSRVFSSSLDRTIKIHDIALGSTLLTLVFSVGITAFCVDSAETMLFAGGRDGMLFKVDLLTAAKTASESNLESLNVEPNQSKKDMLAFKGHSQEVTCMSFNSDCTLVITGSEDKTIHFWDVFSIQSIRTVNCKAAVTNLYITFSPPGIASTDYKPTYPFPKLARATADPESEEIPTKTLRLDEQFYDKQLTKNTIQKTIDESLTKNTAEDPVVNLQKMKKEVNNLQEINKKLFDFAVDNLLVNK